jgi:hypothetical protein
MHHHRAGGEKVIARFAVYDVSTGRILRTGSCPEAIMDLQALEGEAVLEAAEDVSVATHHVVDGVITPL